MVRPQRRKNFIHGRVKTDLLRGAADLKSSYDFSRFFPAFEGASIVIAVTYEAEELVRNAEMLVSLCEPRDIAQIIIGICDRTTPEAIAAANNICERYPEFNFTIYKQKINTIGHIFRETLPLLTGSHVAYAASDGGTDISLIPKFISHVKQCPGVIPSGTRWKGKNGFVGYGKIRKLLNHLFERFIAFLYCSKETDFTCPNMLVSVAWYRSVELKENSMALFVENRFKMARVHLPFKEYPAVWKHIDGTKEKIPWKRLFVYLKAALKVRFTNPEKFLRV